MPSKPFYSMEEVCAKLGKNADQVKGLVRNGALREFRDAGKVFFKAEDIEKLAGKDAAPSSEESGEILLEPVADKGGEASGVHEPPSLADSGRWHEHHRPASATGRGRAGEERGHGDHQERDRRVRRRRA